MSFDGNYGITDITLDHGPQISSCTIPDRSYERNSLVVPFVASGHLTALQALRHRMPPEQQMSFLYQVFDSALQQGLVEVCNGWNTKKPGFLVSICIPFSGPKLHGWQQRSMVSWESCSGLGA